VVQEDADSYCDDRGVHMHGDHDWNNVSMDLEVTIPTNVTVSAGSVSGNVDITGANGDVEAGSVSGDIRLTRLRASSVSAHTVSGNVDVRVDAFTGRGDLSFKSVSGDVTLEVPRGFDADISMSTVSGDMNSDFPVTLGNGRMSHRRIEARVGSGGRRLDVSTVSGSLNLKMAR
jgi:lia operon protein LiaG